MSRPHLRQSQTVPKCFWQLGQGLIPPNRVIYSCKVLVGPGTPYLGPDSKKAAPPKAR